MLYSTIGYHTIRNKSRREDIKKNAPFKCTRANDWLSHGYYFWDDDIDRAHDWGRKSLDNDYLIVKFRLKELNTLDLVGRRSHQIKLQELIKEIKKKLPQYKNVRLPISKAIYLLRIFNKEMKGIFDFDSVKAQDSPNPQFFNFIDRRKEQTDLNSRIQICIFEKNVKKILHEEIIGEIRDERKETKRIL